MRGRRPALAAGLAILCVVAVFVYEENSNSDEHVQVSVTRSCYQRECSSIDGNIECRVSRAGCRPLAHWHRELTPFFTESDRVVDEPWWQHPMAINVGAFNTDAGDDGEGHPVEVEPEQSAEGGPANQGPATDAAKAAAAKKMMDAIHKVQEAKEAATHEVEKIKEEYVNKLKEAQDELKGAAQDAAAAAKAESPHIAAPPTHQPVDTEQGSPQAGAITREEIIRRLLDALGAHGTTASGSGSEQAAGAEALKRWLQAGQGQDQDQEGAGQDGEGSECMERQCVSTNGAEMQCKTLHIPCESVPGVQGQGGGLAGQEGMEGAAAMAHALKHLFGGGDGGGQEGPAVRVVRVVPAGQDEEQGKQQQDEEATRAAWEHEFGPKESSDGQEAKKEVKEGSADEAKEVKADSADATVPEAQYAKAVQRSQKKYDQLQKTMHSDESEASKYARN